MDRGESFPDWYLEEQALSTAKIFFLRDENVRLNDISEMDTGADLLVQLDGEASEPVPVQVVGVPCVVGKKMEDSNALVWTPEEAVRDDIPTPFLVFVFSAEDEETYISVVARYSDQRLSLLQSQDYSASDLIGTVDLIEAVGHTNVFGQSPSQSSDPPNDVSRPDSSSARTLDMLKRLM